MLHPASFLYRACVLLLLACAACSSLRCVFEPLLKTGDLLAEGKSWLFFYGLLTSLPVAAFLVELREQSIGLRRKSSGFELRAALYALLGSGLFFVATVEPFEGSRILPTFASAAAILAAGLLIGKLVRGRLAAWPRARRALAAADLTLLYLSVLIIGGEVSLRILAGVTPSVLLSRSMDDAAQNLASLALEPGSERLGFPVDPLGNYDTPPTRPPREHPFVLSIGDSFSAGIVPHDRHFTTVAEGRLEGVEIYNMGTPGIGLPEYLYLLKTEGLPLRPDLIVVNVFLGNDLSLVLPPADEIFWRRWLSQDNFLLYQVVRRLAASAKRRGSGDSVNQRMKEAVAAADSMEWLDDPSLERPTFSSETFDQIETFRLRAVNDLSDFELHRRFAYLREIAEAAGETPIVFMLIPDEYQVEEEVWARISSGGDFLRDRAHRELVKWLDREGLDHLDLLPVLRYQRPMPSGRLHLYHLQDTHFNSRGNRVAGEALGQKIARVLAGGEAPQTVQHLSMPARGAERRADLQILNASPLPSAVELRLDMDDGAAVEVQLELDPEQVWTVHDIEATTGLEGNGRIAVRGPAHTVASLRLGGGEDRRESPPEARLSADRVAFFAFAGAGSSLTLVNDSGRDVSVGARLFGAGSRLKSSTLAAHSRLEIEDVARWFAVEDAPHGMLELWGDGEFTASLEHGGAASGAPEGRHVAPKIAPRHPL